MFSIKNVLCELWASGETVPAVDFNIEQGLIHVRKRKNFELSY